MEIHKPKPVHSWRELLTEIGVIVIGVAIALAGEQAVETLRNRSRAAEARASIRAEIAVNLGRMNARETTEACMTKKLDEVDGLIADYSRGIKPPQAVWIGVPVIFEMLDGKYKAATQSGAVSLFDDSEQAAYAQIYANFEFYWQQLREEVRAWNDLRTLEKRPPWSAVLDWQLRSAMQQARYVRFNIGLLRRLDLSGKAAVGIAPTPQSAPPPPACLPLNTPREQALKQLNVANPDVRFP